MRKVPVRRAALAVVMLSTVVTSGCFGSFPLTRKMYNWNKGVSSDKWVRELVFVATALLVPVYSVAGLIDVVILNSQEFWTGKSSVASTPETKVKTLVRGNVTIKQTMTQLATGRTMILEETVDGKLRSRTTLRQATGASVVTAETEFADGRKETKSLSVDEAGAMTISSANGLRRVITDTEVAVLTSRFKAGSVAEAVTQ